MWILTTVVVVIGSLCWVTWGIVGYRRIWKCYVGVEPSKMKQLVRVWSCRSGAGMALLLGTFFVLLVIQSGSEIGWTSRHGVILAITLAAAVLGGACTSLYFYLVTERKMRHRRQGSALPSDTRLE